MVAHNTLLEISCTGSNHLCGVTTVIIAPSEMSHENLLVIPRKLFKLCWIMGAFLKKNTKSNFILIYFVLSLSNF